MEDTPHPPQPMDEDSEMPDVSTLQVLAEPEHLATAPAAAATETTAACLSGQGSGARPSAQGPLPWPLPPQAGTDPSSTAAAAPQTHQEQSEAGLARLAAANREETTQAPSTDTAASELAAPKKPIRAPANLVTSWGPSAPPRRIIASSAAVSAPLVAAAIPPAGACC